MHMLSRSLDIEYKVENIMDKIYDTIIIGGGPSGYTAALYASRAGLETLIIEKMSVGGQMAVTDIIDNYPGFDEGIDGFELGMRMQKGAERFGAVTKYASVLSVDVKGKTKKVTTSSGDFFSKTVIIATGAKPRELGVEKEEEFAGRGIHYCAHCDGRFYKDKIVGVAGGGNTAVSDALYLSKLAKKVYLIHRRDTFRADKIYTDALSGKDNIEFVKNSTVDSLISGETLSGITIKSTVDNSTTAITLDGLFVSIGRNPETEIFKDVLTMDAGGYIVADESTRTNIPGVFAIGDVRTKALRQVVTAVADGAVAVHYASEYLSELM